MKILRKRFLIIKIRNYFYRLNLKVKFFKIILNKKVETGDAKIYTNKNLAGTGYKFDKEESMKVKHARDAMRKFFESDIEDLSDDLDDDKITKRDHKPVEEKTEMSEKKLQKKYMELIKDPSTKASVMSAATKAAKDAIMVGASSEEVLQAAQNAIKSNLHYIYIF